MKNKTEKDFWIEMSIREIWTQAHFAELAYQNIDPKTKHGIDTVFSSIHSFLSHCTMVSKLLKAKEKGKITPIIGFILGVKSNSVIHNRRFRNHLEHYDERLKQWIREKGINSNIGTYNIGPKSMIQIPNMVFVSHYNPSDNVFTFVNEDLKLGELFEEVQRVKKLADNWVKTIEFGTRKPPFDKNIK